MGSDVSLSKAVRANLLSLQNTATMMDKTQNRLATGNKVNSALDNPSNFFTASALNSRAADMSNLLDSMASGIKVIEAANNGITALTKNLESMQSTLRQARQDKSFQTKSFEVTDNTKIKLSGGQFGDLNADISLATATVPGVKAELETSATSYLGPVSTSASASGAGARSVISGLSGFAQNDVFEVAGVSVTVSNATPNATNVAADISAALAGDASTAGKYTVTEGTGANAGKIIIETVDTSAAAAEIVFDTNADGDTADATEVGAATKGSTTFNYSAITSSVTAGGQTIATGATYEDFKANLAAGAAAGNYTFTADDSTKQITLTSTQWGGAAPTVTGVPTASGGSASTTAFQLTNTGGGTPTLTDAQDLTIGGASGPISLTAGMTAAQVQTALRNDTALSDKFTINVDATFNVTMTEKTNGGLAAPTVTSSLPGATFNAASVTGAGGANLAALTNAGDMDPYAGLTISISDGTNTDSYTIAVGDDITDLQTALTGAGYTVTGTASGLDIVSTSGANFTVTFSGSVSDFGLGAATSITSTNGVVADAPGIVGGNAAVVATPGVAGVNGQTITPPLTGASVETIAAEEATFTVSYDGKTANVSIGGVKGGIGSAVNALDIKNWQDATIEAVNADLEAAGITGVEAKFDTDGKFQLVAKTAEAKTLAVSGDDAVALFGTNGVNTGVAEKSQLNATKTVDKFVELINRDFGGKVRASNDNGKLRIENLSTQELDIGIDINGNDAIVGSKIEGNTVRSNLSKQFNELRDQLDKLSDDSSFNGINLLRGDKLKITFNESGTSSIDIQAKDKNGNVRGINASNLGVDSLIAEDLDTDEKIDAFLSKLSSALTELRSQASAFGSNLSSVENRQTFTKNMINTLETGAANLTLADTNEEAANLLALQTRQQLSSSALSMASQQDQAVLQLLR